MSVKLLTEQHLEFLSLKEAVQARLSKHLSICHIGGNIMSRLVIVTPATPMHCSWTDWIASNLFANTKDRISLGES